MRGLLVKQDAFPRAVEPLVIPEIVTFPDEIDIRNARRLAAELLAAMRPDVSVVIADLTLTKFCDSSGVRSLMLARDYASDYSIDLRVAVPSKAVRRSLHAMDADRRFPLYPSLQNALSSSPRENSRSEDQSRQGASARPPE
jgi:anti-anti-sigma factor